MSTKQADTETSISSYSSSAPSASSEDTATTKIRTAEEILFSAEVVTPYELAQLCQQAYAKLPKAKVSQWTFLSSSAPNANGYYGVAYLCLEKNYVVIAHRGTDPSLFSNLLSDASLAISKLPAAQEHARNFSEQVRSCVSEGTLVIETGHSLGGFHAEMNVAFLASGYAMSFESPGTAEMCEALQLRVNPDRLISLFSIPNVINTAKAHIGAMYEIGTYRLDRNGLLRLDYGSYLQPLTEALIKSVTPVDSAVKSSMAMMKTTSLNVAKRQAQHHSLDSLMKSIHPVIGYPWLMRKMFSWPSLDAFLNAQSLSSGMISMASFQSRSLSEGGIEIVGYSADQFISAPNLGAQVDAVARSYRISALTRFDAFYQDAVLRQQFIRTMRLTEAEVAMVPVPKERPLPSSSFFTAPSAASRRITPTVSVSMPKVEDHTVPPTKERVILANSMLSERFLIEEKKWLISLVKSSGEHAFLLLEGIKDGELLQLRTDFFLDMDGRADVVSKLPIGFSSALNLLWGSSEHLVGRGFVRSKALAPKEYERLLEGCEHQSWSISAEQAENFLVRMVQEIKKPYIYAISGDHPASSVSAGSGSQAHNCISWCQTLLLEELNIRVGSRWSLIKRPSSIVRQTIRENVEIASGPLSGDTSSSFFQRASFTSTGGTDSPKRPSTSSAYFK